MMGAPLPWQAPARVAPTEAQIESDGAAFMAMMGQSMPGKSGGA